MFKEQPKTSVTAHSLFSLANTEKAYFSSSTENPSMSTKYTEHTEKTSYLSVLSVFSVDQMPLIILLLKGENVDFLRGLRQLCGENNWP